jgi:hypothetical protein
VYNFAQREDNQTLSIMQFSRASGYQSTRVKTALDNGLEALKVRDRHMAVDEIQKLKFWNGLTHE